MSTDSDTESEIRMTLDFETYYDPANKRDGVGYTLREMSPAEYILDDRFEMIGAAVRFDTYPLDARHGAPVGDFRETARYLDAAALPCLFASLPWHRIVLVSHNTPFDGFILAHRYGYVPKRYIDTLALSRAFIFYRTGRASLAKVAEELRLPAKGTEIENMRGVSRARLNTDPVKLRRFVGYTCRDTNLAAWVAEMLGPRMPADEWIIMDMVLRMSILPQLTLDDGVLHRHLMDVLAQKERVMQILREEGIISEADDTKVQRASLLSNQKYAQLLQAQGIDPPTKISPTTGQPAYAFAKNDQEFTALADHPDPIVQALVSARLGIKSTQEETRTQRFIRVAHLPWGQPTVRALDSAGMGALLDRRTQPVVVHIGHFPMPFPLRYSGAHTHRLSGDWSWNLQNLGRKSPLRRALKAPRGYKIVSADASQIEARIVSTLAGATRLVEGFRTGEDVYSTFAAMVYGKPINKKDNPDERFVGKTGVLGLGFGMGPPKFVLTCYNQSPPDNRTRISDDLGRKVVSVYRTQYAPQVKDYWGRMERLMGAMLRGEPAVDGPLTVIGQSIMLSNGMFLYYHGIEQRPGTRSIRANNGVDINISTMETRFKYGNEWKYLFGGKLTENVVQALARIATMSAAVHIRRDLKIPFPLAGQVHDQLVYIVPERDAEAMAKVLVYAMRRPVPWLPELPLEAEAGIGDNLLDLKEIKVPRIAPSTRFAA